MNLREKGGSNLLVLRRNRREQSRFRPSRSCPLLSPPDRIRGKIQPVNPSPSQQQAMQQEVASYRSARASQNCLSQLPNPFTPSSLLDFGQLRGLGAPLQSRGRGWAWQWLPLSPFLGMTRS